jgi:hypothetical protein
MADKPMPVTPRDMRPRSTPNAEINAQQRDEWRYDQKIFERPEIKDIPKRGYKRGGKVRNENPFARGGPMLPRT